MTVSPSYSQVCLTDTQTRTGVKLIAAFEERGELLTTAKAERGFWRAKFYVQKSLTDSVTYTLNRVDSVYKAQIKAKNAKIAKEEKIIYILGAITTILFITLVVTQ